jgi:hypothetical protein
MVDVYVTEPPPVPVVTRPAACAAVNVTVSVAPGDRADTFAIGMVAVPAEVVTSRLRDVACEDVP